MSNIASSALLQNNKEMADVVSIGSVPDVEEEEAVTAEIKVQRCLVSLSCYRK